jgi:hypothetical protein
MFVAGILAAVGILTAAPAMRWGPWAQSDSVEYVEAARNFAAGRGPVLVRASGRVVPIYLRPPGYSLLLGAALNVDSDVTAAGKWIDLSLFFAVLILPAALSQEVRRNPVLLVGWPVYLTTSTAVVGNFTGLMSEPLFLASTLASVGAAAVYWRSGKVGLLVAASILACVAGLTRYSGAVCASVCAISALANPDGPLWKKARSAAGAMAVALLPVGIWLLWIRDQGFSPVYSLPSRSLWAAIQPVRVAYVEGLWDWLPIRFLIPISGYRARAVLLALLIGVAAVISQRVTSRSAANAAADTLVTRPAAFASLLLAFSGLHALFVGISYVVVELPRPVLDERVLLPSRITMILGLLLLFEWWSSRHGARLLRYAFPIALVLPLALEGWPATREYVLRMNAEGRGYTARVWHQSALVGALRNLPVDMAIVSNDIDAVTFFAERGAFLIPEFGSPLDPDLWRPFGETPRSDVERLFAGGEAALALFASGGRRFSELYEARAQERVETLVRGLEVVYEGPEGGIYISPVPPS